MQRCSNMRHSYSMFNVFIRCQMRYARNAIQHSCFLYSQSISIFCFQISSFKAGVHLKAVFWLGIMFLMQISRLRFKQSRICSLITHIYVLRRFVNFLVIFRFIWRQIVFLKGLVKFMEIGNFEDLVLF